MADILNGDASLLAEQVKDKCRITWADEKTEKTIADELVPNGCAAIRFLVGIPDNVDFDFSLPGTEHRLFLNWCYYAWHDAEDDFAKNYSAEIAQSRRFWEVAYVKEQTRLT